MLVMKATYNSKIAPFAFDYVKSEVIPVNVNVSMAVIDVLSISEKDLVYVLKFRFLMVWYDPQTTISPMILVIFAVRFWLRL